MHAPMPVSKWPSRLRVLGIAVLGYLAAVLAGSLMLSLLGMWDPSGKVLWTNMGFIAPVMAVFALPGWVALRMVLYLLKWTGLGALVVAGAFNGLAVVLFFSGWSLRSMDDIQIFTLSGAVAGYGSWWAERALRLVINVERPAE